MPKSLYESDIEKITSEYNVVEDWQSIMDLCDKLKTTPSGCKEALKCITKRVCHPIPHVSMQALTLLAACVDNCGKPFHLEVCSRDWTNDARFVITRSHNKVSEKLRDLVKKWADDFKEDVQLNLMLQFYKKLKAEGFSFDFESSGKSSAPEGKAKVEDELSFKEDLDLAIAMSLQEGGSNQAPSNQTRSVPLSSQGSSSAEEREVCQVRALYDFEAAEDNEITFKAGEIFSVLDNSDENWWKGRNSRGVGLFPANFVTTELVEEKPIEKKVHFAVPENPTLRNESGPRPEITINEEQLDVTLSMLKNASPNEIDDEEETICGMEEKAEDMGNLIEKKVLACEDKNEILNDLNERLLQALATYQQLMKEPINSVQPMPPSYQSNSSPQHDMPYQQQLYARGQQLQLNGQIPRGYPSQTRVSGLQLDAEGVYQGHPGMMQQNLISRQAMIQSPHSFSTQPASLPVQQISSTPSLSRQPASLPMQGMSLPPIVNANNQLAMSAAQGPPSMSQVSLPSYDFNQVNYNQQQFSTGQLNATENAQYGTQQSDYVNYGYNIPQGPPAYQPASVYQ